MLRPKIFNDPVYGFITIPPGILFELIEHPWFQRLRRISQLGMSGYVYPGALHTRFHHALGALHLMRESIEVLRSKGVTITEKEAEAVSVAILLHDIGHGPFSHALEHTLVPTHHEALSLAFMNALNKEMKGRLSLAITIFTCEHPKKFLSQLVSGQLDMDRMDYLNRDSFFTGVSEGVIGYDRIIKMLSVKDGELVVEEKGIYSIEKFLIARRLMYWQVYLHKTALCAEQMLVQLLRRARELASQGSALNVTKNLHFFLYQDLSREELEKRTDLLLHHFSRLDDVEIYAAMKQFAEHEDFLLSYLANSLLNRRLFKIELRNTPFEKDYVALIRQKIKDHFPEADLKYLLLEGKESNRIYNTRKDEIKILFKNGEVQPLSQNPDYELNSRIINKYYLCYPKSILEK